MTKHTGHTIFLSGRPFHCPTPNIYSAIMETEFKYDKLREQARKETGRAGRAKLWQFNPKKHIRQRILLSPHQLYTREKARRIALSIIEHPRIHEIEELLREELEQVT